MTERVHQARAGPAVAARSYGRATANAVVVVTVVLALVAVLVVAELGISAVSSVVVLPLEWFASPMERVLLLTAVSGLFACVLLAGWVELRRRTPGVPWPAVAASALAMAWAALPVTLWVPQPWIGAAAFVVAAVLPVAMLHLVVTTSSTVAAPRPGRRARALWCGAYVALPGLALVLVLARDPFLDPRCLVVCSPVTPPLGDAGMAGLADAALRMAWAAAGMLTASAAAVGYRRARGPLQRTAAAAGLACGAVEIAWALAPSAAAVVGPAPLDGARLLAARLLLHAALAATAAALLIRDARRQRQVRRMVREIAAATPPTNVRHLLATRLGDPGVRILFRVPDGRVWVDENGLVVTGDEPMPGSGERTPPGEVLVVREGRDVARILVSHSDLDLRDVADALGPATVLALESEGAAAELKLRLRHLSAARRRVVEESDEARRRAERDLHDGAQHLLLAATFAVQDGLAAARDSGDAAARAALQHALGEITEIAAQLRGVAHGVYPVLLGDAGLVRALEGLALSSPVPASVHARLSKRPPPSVELTLYQACSAAVLAPSDDSLVIDVSEKGDLLMLSIDGADVDRAAAEALSDRAAALGGRVWTSPGAFLMEVPCA